MPTERQAAAVLLLRRGDSGETEILLIRRGAGLAYLPGFDAFPGGATDPQDLDEASDPGATSGATGGVAATLRTASRELEEEVGVRIRADADGWLRCGRFHTPPYAPINYRADFYAAWLPPGQQARVCSDEVAAVRWWRPAAALEAHAAGELWLTFPALTCLRALARHAQLAEAAAELEALAPARGGEMAAGVHLLPLRAPTLPPATHTNVFILGGEELVIVDPASPEPAEQELLAVYVEKLCRGGARVRAIWLTHHHPDHVGGVGALRERLGVPVAAHRATAAASREPLPIDAWLEDDERVTLSLGHNRVAKWQILHTPGHAPGHLSLFEQTRRILLSGDNILTSSTVVIVPPKGDMAAYLHSLARVQALEPRLLFPAHGPPTGNPAPLIAELIAHRLEREQQVLAAMATPSSTAQIAARVYLELPAAAHAFAELNVRAHLDKLSTEGRVAQDDGARWRRT